MLDGHRLDGLRFGGGGFAAFQRFERRQGGCHIGSDHLVRDAPAGDSPHVVHTLVDGLTLPARGNPSLTDDIQGERAERLGVGSAIQSNHVVITAL